MFGRPESFIVKALLLYCIPAESIKTLRGNRASPLGIGPGVHLSVHPIKPLRQSEVEYIQRNQPEFINEAAVHGWSDVGNDCFHSRAAPARL